MSCEREQLVLAASTAQFFLIGVLVFRRSRERDRKKQLTSVMTKQTHIWSAQHLICFAASTAQFF